MIHNDILLMLTSAAHILRSRQGEHILASYLPLYHNQALSVFLTSAISRGYAAFGGGAAPSLPCLHFLDVLNESINPITQHLKHHLQQPLDAHCALQPCPHALQGSLSMYAYLEHPSLQSREAQGGPKLLYINRSVLQDGVGSATIHSGHAVCGHDGLKAWFFPPSPLQPKVQGEHVCVGSKLIAQFHAASLWL